MNVTPRVEKIGFRGKEVEGGVIRGMGDRGAGGGGEKKFPGTKEAEPEGRGRRGRDGLSCRYRFNNNSTCLLRIPVVG